MTGTTNAAPAPPPVGGSGWWPDAARTTRRSSWPYASKRAATFWVAKAMRTFSRRNTPTSSMPGVVARIQGDRSFGASAGGSALKGNDCVTGAPHAGASGSAIAGCSSCSADAAFQVTATV